MKRWIIAGVFAATGCQTAEQTSTVEQGLIASCIQPGGYANAKMPKYGIWSGQPAPQAQPGQLYMDMANPNIQGEHIAVIADPIAGEIVWAVRVKDKDVPAYRSTIQAKPDHPMIGDCCRPPPPPIGGGDQWLVYNFLETGHRMNIAVDDGLEAANGYPWP